MTETNYFAVPGTRPSLISVIEERFGLDPGTIGMKTRKREWVKPRYLYFYLVRESLGATLSYQQIADKINGCGHTFAHCTVIHGIKTCERDMATDRTLKMIYKELKTKIQNDEIIII
mgnify:CR=1 FL=1